MVSFIKGEKLSKPALCESASNLITVCASQWDLQSSICENWQWVFHTAVEEFWSWESKFIRPGLWLGNHKIKTLIFLSKVDLVRYSPSGFSGRQQNSWVYHLQQVAQVNSISQIGFRGPTPFLFSRFKTFDKAFSWGWIRWPWLLP